VDAGSWLAKHDERLRKRQFAGYPSSPIGFKLKAKRITAPKPRLHCRVIDTLIAAEPSLLVTFEKL